MKNVWKTPVWVSFSLLKFFLLSGLEQNLQKALSQSITNRYAKFELNPFRQLSCRLIKEEEEEEEQESRKKVHFLRVITQPLINGSCSNFKYGLMWPQRLGV